MIRVTTLRAWACGAFFLAAFSTTMTDAAEVELKAGSQHAQHFAGEVAVQADFQYLLFLPESYHDSVKAWPMIVFLHGSGESGNNLELVKKHGPPKIVENKPDFPFIVLSPQSALGGWDASALVGLVDNIAATYRVDRDRIYLTGLSMGGYGTWALAAAYPDRFAAIVPICGGGYPHNAERLASLPTWVFHGAKDESVPIRRSRQMVDALRAVGADVTFTIDEEAGHDSWTAAYDNPKLYDWLLEHKRESAEWTGTWESRGSHAGTLACRAWRVGADSWKAEFTGYCNREFAYRVEMLGKETGDLVEFSGEANLGEADGGVFTWKATMTSHDLTGEYGTKGGKAGSFALTKSQ